MQVFDSTMKDMVGERLLALEKHFDADVIFYCGEISPAYCRIFRDFVESLAESKEKRNRLIFILNTPGGSVEAVEKMVEIIRYHYADVQFVVPDYAMSAGTVLCMSGSEIHMDYSSSLGPIDPQVNNGKQWVPALGYLDQVDKLIEKAKNNTLTNAEFLILQNQDLATLSRYEQQRDLTIALLKKWLVQYKFANWDKHLSDPARIGQPVTREEKEKRAEEIATNLSNNREWNSHGRMIGIQTLMSEPLRLRIADYSKNDERRKLIRSYNDLITEYILREKMPIFVHHRHFF